MKKIVLILMSLTTLYCGSDQSQSLKKAHEIFDLVETNQFDSLYKNLTTDDQSAMTKKDFFTMIAGMNMNVIQRQEMSGDTTYILKTNGDSVWVIRKYFLTDRAKVREIAGSKDKYSETLVRLETEKNVPLIMDSALICLVRQNDDFRIFLNLKNREKYDQQIEDSIARISKAISYQTENIAVEKLGNSHLVRFQFKFTNGNKIPVRAVVGNLLVNGTKAGIYEAAFAQPLLPDSSVSFKSTTDLKQYPALESLIDKKKTINDLTREPIEIQLWSSTVSLAEYENIMAKAMAENQFYVPKIFPPIIPDLRNR